MENSPPASVALDDFPLGLQPLRENKGQTSSGSSSEQEWKVFSDFEEDEESTLTTASSSVLSKKTGTTLFSKFSKRSSSSVYPVADGRFTEGPAVDNVVEEEDLFSPHNPLEKSTNDIGLTSSGSTPIKYSTVKKLGRVCSWLGVLCLFIFGFGIFFAILSITATITAESEPQRFNATEALSNSTLFLAPLNNHCNLNYTVPDGCNSKINELEGCITGCYLSETEGDCGLTFNVNYTDIPRTKDLSKIYLLATADGTHFWQTGRPLPITGDPTVSLVNATGSGTISDGCYGQLGSIAVLACLSQDDLLATTYTGFPDHICMASYGTCVILDDVWVKPIPGCIGPKWLGNNVTIEDLAAASSFSISWVSIPLILASLFL